MRSITHDIDHGTGAIHAREQTNPAAPVSRHRTSDPAPLRHPPWSVFGVRTGPRPRTGGGRVDAVTTERRVDVRVNDPDWLRDAYERATVAEVAAERGVAVKTVSRRFATLAITARPVGEQASRQRRWELNDPEWLHREYEHRSTRDIADELGVNPQQVLAALHRHDIGVRSGPDTFRMRHPELHDPAALSARVADTSVADVAAVSVHAALRRHGVHSTHRYNGKRPIQPPPDDVVEQWWDTDATIIGIARRGGVSVNTAAIWLAKIGIFVNDMGVADGLRDGGIDLRHWPIIGTSAGSFAAAAIDTQLGFDHVAALWERYIDAAPRPVRGASSTPHHRSRRPDQLAPC